jgi:hypothetical protein
MRGAGRQLPVRQPPADPSWVKVIATTLRLWLRRRLLRVPDGSRISNLRRAALAAAVIVVLAAAGGAAVIASASKTPAPRHRPPHPSALAAAQAQLKVNAQAAASWFAAQVGRQVVVGCDPAMCSYLLAAGFPGSRQYVLQPGVSLPGIATMVVSTPTVRGQYGAQLANSAPVVIAGFGVGLDAVQVREVVPEGASGYPRAAHNARAARRTAGAALVANPRVHAQGSARRDLLSGMVDPRLIVVLRRLAARHVINIAWFGDSGPLTGNSLPFRSVELINIAGGHGPHSELASILSLLHGLAAPYHPNVTVSYPPSAGVVVRVAFLAPSPM